MKETTEEPNIRWQRISEIASKYGQNTTLDEKITLIKFVQQDIEQQRKQLESQLAEIQSLLGDNGAPAPAAKKPRAPKTGKKRSRVSVSDEDLLAFVGKGQKGMDETQKHFGASNQTIRKAYARLEKAGKIAQIGKGRELIFQKK